MQTTRSIAEELPLLFHLQTNTSVELPKNLPVINIGKPDGDIPPDIDVSPFPNSDVVSRVHAKIVVQKDAYFIEDAGSSNGTYLNNIKLEPKTRYRLNLEDRIDFCKGGQVTFILQPQKKVHPISTPSSNSAGIASTPSSTQPDEEAQATILSKFIGLGLMLLGIGILSTNIYISVFFRSTPGVVLCIAGVIALNYGREQRKWGWVLIGIGIALILVSGVVIASISLFSILGSFACLAAGYQLFTSGKVFDIDFFKVKRMFGN